MSEKDRFGWPIRMVNGVRLCAREGCEDDEFRIDGYCSMECRDVDEVEIEFRAYRTDVEPVLRAAERVKSTGMSDSTNDNDMDACVDCGYLPPSDEFYAVLGDLYAAVSASRVCQRIAEEGK